MEADYRASVSLAAKKILDMGEQIDARDKEIEKQALTVQTYREKYDVLLNDHVKITHRSSMRTRYLILMTMLAIIPLLVAVAATHASLAPPGVLP